LIRSVLKVQVIARAFRKIQSTGRTHSTIDEQVPAEYPT
jgi:hypothetical protein